MFETHIPILNSVSLFQSSFKPNSIEHNFVNLNEYIKNVWKVSF